MTNSPTVFGLGVCAVLGSVIPFLADTAATVGGLDLFSKWVQAGGTVGMVGVLLWIRSEEKARREKEEARREAQDSEQWQRYDKLVASNREAFDKLAGISERFSVRMGAVESAIRALAIEVRFADDDEREAARDAAAATLHEIRGGDGA